MKYRVVGWTYYDNPDVEPTGCSEAALQAILRDIREHGYKFTGWEHQELSSGVPVLNDGFKRIFSQRSFGAVMAQAYGDFSRMGYTRYAFHEPFDSEPTHMPPPERDFDPLAFIPETDLREEFTYTVDREVLDAAARGECIRLPNDPALLMIDGGDTLTLCCEDERVRRTVASVDRGPDLTEEEERALLCASSLSYNSYSIQAANDRYDSAPRVLKIAFLTDGADGE